MKKFFANWAAGLLVGWVLLLLAVIAQRMLGVLGRDFGVQMIWLDIQLSAGWGLACGLAYALMRASRPEGWALTYIVLGALHLLAFAGLVAFVLPQMQAFPDAVPGFFGATVPLVLLFVPAAWALNRYQCMRTG